MNVYWFDLKVAEPVSDEHIEALAEQMAGMDRIDATAQADDRGGVVMFSREADNAVQAIVSAITDVEAAGMAVAGVLEDDATVEEIAERAGVTSTAVRYWIAGTRGPGGFPRPKVVRERGSTYSWAEVSTWLAKAKVGRSDYVAAETARAVALIADALSVRRGMRDLPKHDRPLVARLVA